VFGIYGALEQTLQGHKGVVHSIALKGDRIISAAADRKIKQWSLTTSTCHHTVEVCEEQSVQNVLSMITSASKIVCPGSCPSWTVDCRYAVHLRGR
jgi:WD40 repeat protein